MLVASNSRVLYLHFTQNVCLSSISALGICVLGVHSFSVRMMSFMWADTELKSFCLLFVMILLNCAVNTGRFRMFSVITNIYNKETKGPTLMEFFTATRKLKKFFFDN